MTVYQIPLSAKQQTFSITLNSVQYQMTLKWNDADEGGWHIELADSSGSDIISGIPLVTGTDLLSQFDYLSIGGALRVYNSVDGVTPPTYDNIGTTTNLYFVTS